MQLKPEEISKIIKDQIKNYENKISYDETGYVIEIGDGISKVHGLSKCMSNELLEFSNGEYGMALNLEEGFVSVVMLGTDEGIREGDVYQNRAKAHRQQQRRLHFLADRQINQHAADQDHNQILPAEGQKVFV